MQVQTVSILHLVPAVANLQHVFCMCHLCAYRLAGIHMGWDLAICMSEGFIAAGFTGSCVVDDNRKVGVGGAFGVHVHVGYCVLSKKCFCAEWLAVGFKLLMSSLRRQKIATGLKQRSSVSI